MSQYRVGGVEADMSLLLRCWANGILRIGKEGRSLQGERMFCRRCVTMQDYGPMDIAMV